MKTKNNTTKRIFQAVIFTMIFTAISFSNIATGNAANTVTNNKAVQVEQVNSVTGQMLSNPTYWPDFLKETEDTTAPAINSGIEEMVNDSLWWKHQLNEFIEAGNDTLSNS
jgi:hypothetical protein